MSAAALSSAVVLLVPAGVVTLAWAVQTWRWICLPSAFGLLPPLSVRSGLVVLRMGLGATRLVLASGVHLSARRLHPSLVIVLFVVLSLMHHFLSGAGLSALLPACAAAMLVGEGTTMALAMFATALMLRAHRRQEAA